MKKFLVVVLAALAAALPLAAETNPFFDVTGLAPALVNFTSEKDAQELAKTRRVVYFFAADWCELCQGDLHLFRTRTGEIPADVTLVLVDFDNADELRLKYGIPLQDVFLQIDAEGRKKTLWVGGGLKSLQTKIKS